MLKKLSDFVVKQQKIILIVFAVLLILAILGTVFLVLDEDKLNSDLMSYFTEDFQTAKGLAFLQKNFGIAGDAMLAVRGSGEDEGLRQAVKNIRAMEGINQLIWVEDAAAMNQLKAELENIDFDLGDFDVDKLREQLESNILTQTMVQYLDLLNIMDMTFDTSGLEEFLKRKAGSDQYTYVLIVMMEYSASSTEAHLLLDAIKEEFSGRAYASAGMTQTAQSILYDTMRELPTYLIIAIIAVILILFLTSSSFIEPLILIVTLCISVLISMGINYLYPSISVITFATSAILQLAITMDYAIFYMHIYKKNRRELSALDATKAAIPEVVQSVVTSGLTTVGGFVALYFMRFGIGADISNVIIKGILLSMLTVILLQPILTLLLDKVIFKTTHHIIEKQNQKRREKNPNAKELSTASVVRPVAKFAVWQRIVLLVIAVGLLVPAFLGQNSLSYSYFNMNEETPSTPEEVLASQLGNQIIMAVPVTPKSGTQEEFIAEVLADPHGKVSGITGAFTIINTDSATVEAMLHLVMTENGLKTMQSFLRKIPGYLDETNTSAEAVLFRNIMKAAGIEPSEIDISGIDLENIDFEEMLADVDLSMLNSYFAKVGDDWYTMYTVSINGSAEDDAAAAAYQYLLGVQSKYFGDKCHSIGMVTASYDMRTVTPVDFVLVTLISAGIILLIIALLLKNPLKSFLLVLLIELGIWINLSITYLLGQDINFMVYIVISSLQLGVTVDYAILLANTFEKNRDKYTSAKECAVASVVESLPAIFTSVLIIVSVCLSVYFVSKNTLMRQLTGMLARGAAISFVLVALMQTAMMSFFPVDRKKAAFEKKLESLEEKLQDGNKQMKTPNEKK